MYTIVFCLDYYYPHIGGSEVLFTALAEGLAHIGWTVVVITQKVPGAPFREVVNGVQIRRVQSLGSRYLFSLTCLPALWKAARKAHILHATTFASTLPAWFISKICRLPLVLTVHEVWVGKWQQVSDAGRLSNWLNNIIERFVYLFDYQHYIAVSKATANDLRQQCNVNPEKIAVIYNGLDYSRWKLDDTRRAARRRELGLEGRHVFFFSGRPGCSKGLPWLIQAMENVIKTEPDCRLLAIVSHNGASAKGYREIRRMIAERHLEEHVILHEPVPSEQLPEFVSCADTVVVPSLSEGFGFAAAEACALERAVIATNNASLPEVVSGDFLLVPPRDSKALSVAMKRAIGHDYHHRPPVRFPLEDNFRHHLDFYNSLLDSSLKVRQSNIITITPPPSSKC